jgi:uncharacterized membrane protein SpoIIM required for sporulation
MSEMNTQMNRWSSLPALIGLNCVLVAAAVWAGWETATLQQANVTLSGPVQPAPAAFFDDLWVVAGANLRVFVLLLLGAGSLGVFTMLVVLWNSYTLGFGMSVLFRSAPDTAYLMLRYVPLEFLAFALAAAACQALALTVWRCLVRHEPLHLLPLTVVFLAAVAILIIAAVAEVQVKRLLGTSGS